MPFPKSGLLAIGVGLAVIALTAATYARRPVVKDLQPIQWVGSRTEAVVGTAGSATLSARTSAPVPAYWRGVARISAATVSRAVGFSVTARYPFSYSRTATGNWQQSWAIQAYPVYQGYRYQVWSHPLIGSPKLLGTGRAGKPVNVVWIVGPLPSPKPLSDLSDLMRLAPDSNEIVTLG